MTRQEWVKQAEEWDRKAREAYDLGDEIRGELCEVKARACLTAADYAPDEDLERPQTE